MNQSKPHILVVEARFYDDISDALFAGARKAMEAAGASFERVAVPGALEIPAAIRFAFDGARGAAGAKRFDGYVALGCVIRGETTHYDTVAGESSSGLQLLAVNFGLAIGNGILTVENEDQAFARARVDGQDKGGDAARATLAMIALKRQFGNPET